MALPLSSHPLLPRQGRPGGRLSRSDAREGGPIEVLRVEVMQGRTAAAFREATAASARVIDRDGRRIGYVHVWASVGERVHATALQERARPASGSKARGSRGQIEATRTARRSTGSSSTCAARSAARPVPPALSRRDRSARPTARSRNKRANARALRTALRGRTAVLIDHHTRSTAELFVHAYKRERQGPLIGTPHGWRGERRERLRHARRQPALSGRDRASRSMARSWKARALRPTSRWPGRCPTAQRRRSRSRRAVDALVGRAKARGPIAARPKGSSP